MENIWTYHYLEPEPQITVTSEHTVNIWISSQLDRDSAHTAEINTYFAFVSEQLRQYY
jgi:hypothetical protein